MNQEVKELVNNIYSTNKELLVEIGAGKTMHHSYKGGLMYHTYRMLLSSQKISNIYDCINTDILFAGIVLHDVGKIKELKNVNGLNTYTDESVVFNHIYMAAALIEAEAMKINMDTALKDAIVHCVLAHHGKKEYGSPVEPATIEAILVHQMDSLDSKMEPAERKFKAGTIKNNTGGIYRFF